MVEEMPKGTFIQIALPTNDPRFRITWKPLKDDGWLLSENRMLLPIPMKDIALGKHDSLIPLREILERAKQLLEMCEIEYELGMCTLPGAPGRRWPPSDAKIKIVVVGDSGVGKTSLVRRFVLDQFDERYVATMGAKVMKKDVLLPRADGDALHIIVTLWDVMGDRDIVNLSKGPYFTGANGILAVCDVTDEGSLDSLEGWISGALYLAGHVPVQVIANKGDLEEDAELAKSDLSRFCKEYHASMVLTSAKDGRNVEEAIVGLTARIVEGMDSQWTTVRLESPLTI